MPKYCPPYSKAPDKWKGAPQRWTCLSCNRSGLRVRHRHRAWPAPILIPVWGDRRGSRNEVVAHLSVSPMWAWLRQYKWRMNMESGYAYRQTWHLVDGRRKRCNLYIQRVILGLKPGDPLEGHHRDDNPLNNQHWNLERATRIENELFKLRRGTRGTTVQRSAS